MTSQPRKQVILLVATALLVLGAVGVWVFGLPFNRAAWPAPYVVIHEEGVVESEDNIDVVGRVRAGPIVPDQH